MNALNDAAAQRPEPGTTAPRTLSELFFALNWLALQGFGGVIAVAQRELVERLNWMTREQFVESLAVSQVLPGPNIVNLCLMIGDRYFGFRGAMVALAGILLVPMVIVLALTIVYVHFSSIPAVSGALRGMGAVAAGLVIATALKLCTTLKKSAMGLPLGLGFAAVTFVVIALLHLPLLWILGGLGPVAIGIAWLRLGQRR